MSLSLAELPTARARVARALLPLCAAVGLTLAAAIPVLAQEVTDENERFEKIIVAVDAQSTRDPELSVGGETVEVEPGDIVTFRVGVNEEDAPGAAVSLSDVNKTNFFRFVSASVTGGGTCVANSDIAGGNNEVDCVTKLDANSNATAFFNFEVLAPSGNPQDCIRRTNTGNLESAAANVQGGADQAQVEVCPEGSLAGSGELGQTSTEAAPRVSDSTPGLAGLALLFVVSLAATARRLAARPT